MAPGTEQPLEELPAEECLRLLRAHDLGRVAFGVGDRTHIFPVNYAVGDNAVVFRTASGTKLESMPLGRVAFEIDGVETDHAWSVVVHGVAHDITETLDEASQALRRLAVPTLAPGERVHWIQIRLDELSGRRFGLR